MTAHVIRHDYHHMPDWADCADLDGMTVRRVLWMLRQLDWGDLGGATIWLSDGSWIDVELESVSGGALMSSQRAVRRAFDRDMEAYTIRTYTISGQKEV